MTILKNIKKTIHVEKHNLAHALKTAAFNNDPKDLCKAADAVVKAGYEFEELPLLPGFQTAIMNSLLECGWVPKFDSDTLGTGGEG